MFTRARHWSLLWARWIQSTASDSSKLRPGPPTCLINHLRISDWNVSYIFLIYPCVLHAQPISAFFTVGPVIYGKQHTLWSFWDVSFSGGENVDVGPVGCDVMWSGGWIPTFPTACNLSEAPHYAVLPTLLPLHSSLVQIFSSAPVLKHPQSVSLSEYSVVKSRHSPSARRTLQLPLFRGLHVYFRCSTTFCHGFFCVATFSVLITWRHSTEAVRNPYSIN
jgi:hypothetical protein